MFFTKRIRRFFRRMRFLFGFRPSFGLRGFGFRISELKPKSEVAGRATDASRGSADIPVCRFTGLSSPVLLCGNWRLESRQNPQAGKPALRAQPNSASEFGLKPAMHTSCPHPWMLLLLACLLGCARHEPPADLTIINGAEPESLDPAIITAEADMRIGSSLFEGLTRQEPVAARAVPGLAESWDISPDGRGYTFHLRTNLQWSTGEPITADDVVYSWLRELNPATASDYAGQLYYVKNAEAFNTGKITEPVARRRSCAGQIHRARGAEPSHVIFSGHLRDAADVRRAAPDD